MADWFDGEIPCPECLHTHGTYCSCVTADGHEMQAPDQCLCANECHFSGRVAPNTHDWQDVADAIIAEDQT